MSSRSKGMPPPPPPKPKKKKSRIQSNGANLSVAEESVPILTNKDLSEFEDLTKLQPLTEDLVLRCLQARYQNNRFYTWAGVSLLALNPLRDFPALYSTKSIWEYHIHDGPVKDLPPHVFSVAKWAYFSMVHSLGKSVDQSVIVSGESGAGKTESTRYLMKYLAAVGGRTTDEDAESLLDNSRASTPDTGFCSPSWPPGSFPAFLVKKHLLASTPIIEAFGNASTQRNNNSSRFGKFIQLQFDRSASVLGGKIETYLLESTRVVYQAPKERNFHIFYQLLHGLRNAAAVESDPARLEWIKRCKLPSIGSEDFREFRLTSNWDVRPEVDAEDFDTTLAAMRDAELTEEQIGQIFAVLSAILNLGEIEFDRLGDGEMRSESDQRALENAAELLGLSDEFLFLALTTRKFSAPDPSSYNSTTRMKRTSTVVGRCSMDDSKNKRDALCKLLYTRLFEWIITYINSIISKEKNTYSRVGLLDIYGFEILDINSLEQLCINFANEKLQQLYVHQYLQQLQEDLKKEEIQWVTIDYNDNRPCLEALEKGPDSVIGMLNEECQLNRDVDNVRLAQRISDLKNPVLKRVAMNSPSFGRRPGQSRGPEEAFSVKHYAGVVNYSLTNMMEKNKDKVAQDLVDLVDESENGFLKLLFADWENPNELRGESRRQTLLSKFKASLDSLMQHLRATTPHYIRCVKPSPLNPGCFTGPNAVHLKESVSMFDASTVESQLKATGVLETVAISKQLCPVRLGFDEFLLRYGLLSSSSGLRKDADEKTMTANAEMPDVIPGEVASAVRTPKRQSVKTKKDEARLRRKQRRLTFEGIKMPVKKPVTVPLAKRSALASKMTVSSSAKIVKTSSASTPLVLTQSTSSSPTPSTPTSSKSPSPVPPRTASQSPSRSQETIVTDSRRDRVNSIMESVFGVGINNFMMGKSKIFLSETQFQTLEKRQGDKLNRIAFTIQCAWRRYCRERRLESVLLIQAVVRGYLQKIKYCRTKRAVLMVQSFHRGAIVRKRVNSMNRAAGIIARFFKGLADRKKFLKTRAAAVVIQDSFRLWKMRKLERQLKASKRHSGNFAKVSKGKLLTPTVSAISSRKSVDFETPTRSFNADVSSVGNRTLYFTPDTDNDRDSSVEGSDGRRNSGGGDTGARNVALNSLAKASLNFSNSSSFVNTKRQQKSQGIILDEKENQQTSVDQSRSKENIHKNSPPGNNIHVYPDLVRSLTSYRSPPDNHPKPMKASESVSSSSQQSPRNNSYLNGSGDANSYHPRQHRETKWRFRPLEELQQLQRREDRRGSMVFNQRGCIKELPEVPYVEISARGNIVSRRRLTRVPIRFHLTTGDILTNAHVLPWQELTCSITDCLPAYDHVYCNKKHCTTEHIKE